MELSDDEEEYSITVKSQVAEYLRQFIETGNCILLSCLLLFFPKLQLSLCYAVLTTTSKGQRHKKCSLSSQFKDKMKW